MMLLLDLRAKSSHTNFLFSKILNGMIEEILPILEDF